VTAVLQPAISDREFAGRQALFHRAVYASEPFVFDEVMRRFWKPPTGCVAHDHGLIHARGAWHLFVLSNELNLHEKLVDAVRAGDWEAAQATPFAVGDRHLAGWRLTELAEVGFVLTESYGEWGSLAHTNSFVFPFGGRWGNIHCAMSREGQRLCIEWSDDLQTWRPDPDNPVWAPPEWAGGTTVCKGPCVVQAEDRWLIYYNLNLAEGTSTVSLISTTDFKSFEDHGPVIKFPNQYRGTQGCESPCVFVRNGIWHLMVASGDSWWHGISNRPDGFMGAQGIQSATAGGVYDMGPFHVGKVVERDGQWWLTSSYKAEHRWRCRREGRVVFRGENEDEAGLCEGLFLTRIEWDGDRPVLVRPTENEIP
jgi:hypothetical protein